MIAVLVPVHNEEMCLGACLQSIQRAATHIELREEVRIVVALDRCEDRSAAIALSNGAHVVHVPLPGGVGMARASAASLALGWGADWLAMTDADSIVLEDWLIGQRRSEADVFCGVVEVDQWQDYSANVQAAFEECESSCDGHGRVHGANLGVSADFYRRCGGFTSVLCGEDVALVQALAGLDARIARLGKPCVRTSSRRIARAPGGFSAFLQRLERRTMAEVEVPLSSSA